MSLLLAIPILALCNAPLLGLDPPVLLLLALCYLAVNLRPYWDRSPGDSRRLRVMMGGRALFLISAWVILGDLCFWLWTLSRLEPVRDVTAPTLLLTLGLTSLLLFGLLANGFFRVLFTSTRLRVVLRVLLVLLWWCPVVNLVLLGRACRLVKAEYRFETARAQLDDLRQENEVCRTKYPIVLVHGIFFRDWQLVNYWGRIPKALIRNGAQLYYGGQQSAAAVADSAAELKETVLRVLEETGAEKVNLIAHSKGGLDARYAISRLGLAPYVASLTTINTPHRGCIFAQELLDRLPDPLVRWIAGRYEAIFHALGDRDPDFLAGVHDLRADVCAQFNQTVPDVPGVLYQSVMSTMAGPLSAPFPLNFTYLLVRHYDREANDGLVSRSSGQWGRALAELTPPRRRGVSHGDVIDLMREDIPGFDVREYYIALVRDLKNRGL